MASIYQKTVSDKTCILAPREYIMRPFDFGDWTMMRFGMFIGGVTASGDNSQSVDEEVSLITAGDRWTIGIKDSATTALPGQAGSLFVGAGSFGGKANMNANTMFSNVGANNASAQTFVGTSQQGGSAGGEIAPAWPTVTGASTYCGFYVIQFTIANLGLATQTINVAVQGNSSISGTDYSAGALRTLINNAIFNAGITFAWNDGVSARAIPDAIWIRAPFYNNRLRLSGIMAVRYLP